MLTVIPSANKIDSAIPWALLVTSSVFMLFKQYVNIVQLVEASKWLVQGDMEIRRKERAGQKKDFVTVYCTMCNHSLCRLTDFLRWERQ